MSDATSTQTTTPSLLVQGTVAEKSLEKIVLALPGTDYQLLLMVATSVSDQLPEAGSPTRITGTIHAQARRIDVVPRGGRYIEPVNGRPRRLQGRLVAINPRPGTIAVQCAPGCVVLVMPLSPQTPANFAEGQLVSFDVEPGSRFEPMK